MLLIFSKHIVSKDIHPHHNFLQPSMLLFIDEYLAIKTSNHVIFHYDTQCYQSSVNTLFQKTSKKTFFYNLLLPIFSKQLVSKDIQQHHIFLGILYVTNLQ